MRTTSKIRPITAKSAPRVTLNSWKEIAGYLDRDPRTVQLWEKHEGLPVRRLTHQSRASVYALTSEIDAWMRSRSGERAGETAPAETPGVLARAGSRQRHAIYGAAVVVLMAGALAAGMWVAHSRQVARTGGLPMLVVLPFENQTSSDDLLVDGLTEQLTSDLSRAGGFQVISRRSAAQFKGKNLPLRQIGSDLHASLALEGTVAQVGDQTTVTVELVDAAHGDHLWGGTYARSTGTMVSSQAELAGVIATAVARRLTGAAPQASFDTRQVDGRVRQAYLMGLFYWNQRGLENLQKAIASYQEATALDATYAPAHAGLADCYVLMTDRGVMANDEAFGRAKAEARAALALDPSSAVAYNALAFATYRQDWDFAAAEQYFRKAIELNPNYAVAHQWYGEFLGDLRRFDESIAELRKAKELNPLSPMVGADLADGYLHAGRQAEAEAELKRVEDMYPDFVPAHEYLASVYAEMDNLAGATTEALAFGSATGDEGLVRWVEIDRLVTEGKPAQARAAVRHWIATGKPSRLDAFSQARMLFLTGQSDLAYGALERAYREHSWWLVTMLVDPGFKKVREEPRFVELARRVGLPERARSSTPILASNRQVSARLVH